MKMALSLDLEPNGDGSIDGIQSSVEWFKEVVPRGTVYITRNIASALPEVVAGLASDYEIGVHVHPREFGHEHDQLAELPTAEQRSQIQQTRTTVADAIGCEPSELVAFRAGRHSASPETLSVLVDLGFTLDASVNVRYGWYEEETRTRVEPFVHECGIVELPTTYVVPSFFSRVGLSVFPNRILTATAKTLRTDDFLTTGDQKIRYLLDHSPNIASMYVHSYDAIDHLGDRENFGKTFRDRFERVIEGDYTFATAADVTKDIDCNHVRSSNTTDG